MGKREAVYAAAVIRNIALVSYDSASMILSTPVSAPLPEIFARAACLCSGIPASYDQGRILYKNIPCEIAAILLIAIGQAFPS
jgi:hypothetical protein